MGTRHWPEDADEAYEDVCNELREANKRIAELEEDREILRMQLSACGVLALSNTEKSLKENNNMLPEYRCASVDDVADMAKREIALMKKVDGLSNLLLNIRESMRYNEKEQCYFLPYSHYVSISKLIDGVSLNKIKADAIREYAKSIAEPYEYTASYGTFFIELMNYADKLEKSE